MSSDPPVRVNELIDATSATWKRDMLQQVFLAPDVNSILSIPLCTRNMEDTWSWNFEKNGIFTIRSSYRMLVDTKRRREDWLENNAGRSNYEEEAREWTSLWSVGVPRKIKKNL